METHAASNTIATEDFNIIDIVFSSRSEDTRDTREKAITLSRVGRSRLRHNAMELQVFRCVRIHNHSSAIAMTGNRMSVQKITPALPGAKLCAVII